MLTNITHKQNKSKSLVMYFFFFKSICAPKADCSSYIVCDVWQLSLPLVQCQWTKQSSKQWTHSYMCAAKHIAQRQSNNRWLCSVPWEFTFLHETNFSYLSSLILYHTIHSLPSFPAEQNLGPEYMDAICVSSNWKIDEDFQWWFDVGKKSPE